MPAPKPSPIPPEPVRVSTKQEIRRRLYGRPGEETERIIKSFRTQPEPQVAAQAFLDSLGKPDIEPRLSDAELLKRQMEIDRHWQDKLDADAERAHSAPQSCHSGPGDPDFGDRRSDRSWIWGDRR
jgi:hypothetical protein